MTVATALAVSWNPLTNSKLNARKSAKSKNSPAPIVTGSPKSCTFPPRKPGKQLIRLRESGYNIMNKLPICNGAVRAIVQNTVGNRLGDFGDHFQRLQVQIDAEAGA